MRVLKESGGALYVWRNIHLQRSRIILFGLLLVLAFMLFVMNKFPYATVGVILIPLAYGLGVYTYQRKLIWESGSQGERIVTEVLRELGDRYRLLNSVVVPPNRGDTDHIVFGPNGIFVVETKNYTGVVECDGDTWRRHKRGRRGSPYEVVVGSPSNQVKRNAKVLKDFILEHQHEVFVEGAPHLWVHGVVVFIGDAELELRNPTVPVLPLDGLVEFISSQKQGPGFTEEELERLSELLLKHCR